MKRLLKNYLSITLIASLFVMAGCGEDDEVPAIGAPTVSIEDTEEGQETSATVDAGEEVAFTVNVNAPAGYNTFVVNKTTGDGETEEIHRESRPAGTPAEDFTYNFAYTPTTAEAGQDIIFDFIAVDDENREAKETYTIIVNEQQVSVFPATLLYAPAADGSTQSFYSVDNGETYSSDEVTGTEEAVSPLIDFGYYYGQTSMATIASPASFPFEAGQSGWTTQNETLIRMTDLGQSGFNESNSSAAINTAFDDATVDNTTGQEDQLAVGDVLAFETDPDKEGGSKRGLIYVEEIQPGISTTNYIKIQVKVID